MKFTRNIKRILSYYESDNPGVKANLARILMSGKLGWNWKVSYTQLIRDLSMALLDHLPKIHQHTILIITLN